MKQARWIQKTHLFLEDEFVCSNCGDSFPTPYAICPTCRSDMKNTKYNPSWVDEAEGLSTILDDDW